MPMHICMFVHMCGLENIVCLHVHTYVCMQVYKIIIHLIDSKLTFTTNALGCFIKYIKIC